MNPVGESQTPASPTGFVLRPMSPIPMKSRFLIIAIFVCLSIFGCEKDRISRTERLVTRTWKLDKYLVNSIDKTGSLLIRDFTEKLDEDSFYGYSFSFITSTQDTISVDGSTYTLKEKDDSIYFSGPSCALTIDDTIRYGRKCKITSLSKSSFIYDFQLNGRLHEFQMVPAD